MTPVLEILLFWVILPLLILGVIFAFIRLLQGPSLPSRVIALDMMAVLGIGIIVVYAVVSGEPEFVDVASVLALVSFLGTVAFAAYVERRS
jgi:multicomponent Na+:H+ antiporter subunit F